LQQVMLAAAEPGLTALMLSQPVEVVGVPLTPMPAGLMIPRLVHRTAG